VRASEVYVRLLLPKDHPTWLIRTAAETAQAFWNLLLPVGLQGGALSHVDEDEDVSMDGTGNDGFKEEHIQWWFDFLTEKKLKGVSKDTWSMVRLLNFPRSFR
jgi:DCN1-like protein 1/2